MGGKRLRIVHVAQAITRSYGGVQTVVADLSRAQAEAGHQVTIVSTNVGPSGGTLDSAEKDSIERNGVRAFACSVAGRSLLLSPEFASTFKREAKSADIVHVHGLYRFPPTYAARYARMHGLPYVIQTHGALDPYLYARSPHSLMLKRLYERWFDFPNLRGAGAICYTSEEERTRAAFLNLRAPSFVVPIGLDWRTYRELPPRGAFRTHWGIGEAPLVLFLGRLNITKGLDLLVPAFDTLRQKLPDAQLIIAGPENDDYGQKVRSWVHERSLENTVQFVGMLRGPEVTQAYVDADVFVLPSYTENFGMTVVEAMACGLPVVISDQVNIHRDVSETGAGVVTRCDANEVSAALVALLSDCNRRRLMGEAGRRLVRERYTWPSIVDALTLEYQAVIERHRRGTSSKKLGLSS